MDKSLSYTWDSEWIVSIYESPWGVFEKFKYANNIRSIEIFKTFGNEDVRNRDKNFWGMEERNLFSLNAFDGNLLQNILGKNIKELNTKNLNSLIQDTFSPQIQNVIIRNDVFYCTECIENGFHSILHQLIYVDECPFHKKTLSQNCPRCNARIPYLLTEKWASDSFTCKCGASLFNGEKGYHFIQTWKSEKEIISNQLLYFLHMSEKCREYLHHVFFDTNLIQMNKNKLQEYFLSLTGIVPNALVAEYNHYVNTNETNKTRTNIDLKATKESVLDYQAYFIDRINNDFKNIYKSMKRHIRKKYLKKHKSCVAKIIKNKHYNDHGEKLVCIYAYSYVMWIQNIENLDYHWEVGIRRKADIWDRKHAYDVTFIQDIKVLWQIYSNIIENKIQLTAENIENLIWSFDKIYSFFIFQDFKNRLNSYNDNPCMFLNPYMSTDDIKMDFFALYFNDDFKPEFHWWEPLKINKQYYCPFDTKSKKRMSLHGLGFLKIKHYYKNKEKSCFDRIVPS